MSEAHGHSLLEMLIVIAIIGGVIISIPALGLWLGRQGAGLAADQLRADIQLSRMMAIKHQRQCAIVVHAPGHNQYQNSLSRQWVDLSQYRGGVHFLAQGPDGRPAADRIVFNRQGMSTSVPPKDLFLADAELNSIYRIQVRIAGGISLHRWGKDDWY